MYVPVRVLVRAQNLASPCRRVRCFSSSYDLGTYDSTLWGFRGENDLGYRGGKHAIGLDIANVDRLKASIMDRYRGACMIEDADSFFDNLQEGTALAYHSLAEDFSLPLSESDPFQEDGRIGKHLRNRFRAIREYFKSQSLQPFVAVDSVEAVPFQMNLRTTTEGKRLANQSIFGKLISGFPGILMTYLYFRHDHGHGFVDFVMRVRAKERVGLLKGTEVGRKGKVQSPELHTSVWTLTTRCRLTTNDDGTVLDIENRDWCVTDINWIVQNQTLDEEPLLKGLPKDD
eukprot:Rmarinus@m.14207